MNERYRSAKVFMTVNIDVLVNDGMSEQEQEQKMTDLAIDLCNAWVMQPFSLKWQNLTIKEA